MFTRRIFFQKSLACLALILLISAIVYPQNYPNKIRGYKVYQTKVSVKTEHKKSPKKTAAETVIKIGEPELADISMTGITLEIPAEIEGADQNGKVDFLSFQDFKVNGLDVEIEEYREPFELKKDETIILPKPLKVFISAGQTLRGAYKELKDSKAVWTVSGRVFVFGKFKKMGFNFKRVVPIEINLKIENPVKKRLVQNEESK